MRKEEMRVLAVNLHRLGHLRVAGENKSLAARIVGVYKEEVISKDISFVELEKEMRRFDRVVRFLVNEDVELNRFNYRKAYRNMYKKGASRRRLASGKRRKLKKAMRKDRYESNLLATVNEGSGREIARLTRKAEEERKEKERKKALRREKRRKRLAKKEEERLAELRKEVSLLDFIISNNNPDEEMVRARDKFHNS